jgi:hypothetical protein
MLSEDERLIIAFLRAQSNTFVSTSEISKRAAPRIKYLRNPQWARPSLRRLVTKCIIEANAQGQYRLPM